MHELAITKEILDIVLEYAGNNKAKSVESIDIELGQLSTFDEESIRFYFEYLSKDTVAEGAELIFNRIPANAQCKKCGRDFEPEELFFSRCPFCESTEYKIESGDTVKVLNFTIKE